MRKNRLILLGMASASLFALSACQSPANDAAVKLSAPEAQLPAGNRIALKPFLQMIAQADESVRAQALDVEIAREANLGAAAMFEPEFYAELNSLGEFRQVNAEQYRSSSGTATSTGAPDPFWSNTNSAKIGVRAKAKFGATVDLFYSMDEVANSLQQPAKLPTPEYSSKSGVSIKVPLLQGRGKAVNTGDIKIAGLDEKIAEESTRLVKAKRVYDGMRAYVMYQKAAQEVVLRQKVLDLTEQLAIEVEKQVKTGLRNTSDLAEARAQVASRQALLTESLQSRDEQLAAIQIFFYAMDGAADRSFVPSEAINTQGGAKFALGEVDSIMARRPEVKVQELEIEKTEIASLLAKDAAKPSLDLNVELSKSRLEAEYVSFKSLFGNENPYGAWRVGFEFRRGIWGNKKPDAEYRAAQLREEQAALTMKALRQKMAGEVNSTRSILIRAQRAVEDQNNLVTEQTKLLEDEKGRAKAGLSTAVDTITREIELCLAKESQNTARAQLQMAQNLSAHVSGTLLDAYSIQ